MEVVIAVSRWLLPFLAVVILVKCLLPLLFGHPKEKTYGYLIDTLDGERYALNMWETSIGRSNSCDIVIGYPTVSRFQAVISRRIDGWYIYDLLSKSGIQVNGEACDKKHEIHAGDTLSFGGVSFRFAVVDDPVIRVGKRKRQAAAQPAPRPVSPTLHTDDVSSAEAPLFLADYYDSANKPQLHFSRGTPVPGLISNGDSAKGHDVYSDRRLDPSFTGENEIVTPNRGAGVRHVLSRPVLFNPATKETFLLTGNRVAIGRARGCDIVLSSPSVSRRHASLVLYEDGWAVDDSSSTYGTFLNGTPVTAPQLLFDGDVLQFGDERLTFKAGKVGAR